MGEILKPAGQWIAQNIPLTVLIGLLILSIFFKIPRKEINVLGWLIKKLGNLFLGGVRDDIKDLKEEEMISLESGKILISETHYFRMKEYEQDKLLSAE